jgi:chromatin segregation and condensation protein Rec8/ScpA/Scc1 (kleisin family)
LANVGVGDLARAFERVLRKAQPEPITVVKPRKSLQEQMKLVLLAISNEWRRLEDLITQPYTRSDAVYWFLALLELIRLGQVVARVTGEEVEFTRCPG